MTGDVPRWLVRFIGPSELLGALGLILPAVMRIKPALTGVAALGLLTIMVLLALFHASRGEFGMLPVNSVPGALPRSSHWAG